ncbi:YdbL family protein [Oligosphaera ethanolica]|jgi:uncharacterized protein YdbL (DUF1318 family)|uniref:Uncharacterized protein YdbL (DUF1318 family) n=1 Tax=Oligosphaera ethanolica TaxID=760260 RepID=A0AAE3VIF2_9BACT|nr:YdbL family protein [Oligosphaera ethanolica]MDQ0290986.1 uncharacterized protein YdbL (DUF1318 family) [Oligosphaera ethanolica]
MKKMLIVFAVLMLALPAFLPVASAQDAATIKQNMINRLPAIAAMKSKGLAGEDNRGYLAAVSSQLSAADQAVIDAENADRKVVYEAIAQKTGATADLVGKQRAKQLAEQAAAGEYIMDENGTWKKK